MKSARLKMLVKTFDSKMIRSAHHAIKDGETLGCPTFMMLGEIIREDFTRSLLVIFIASHSSDKIKEFNPSSKAVSKKTESPDKQPRLSGHNNKIL